MANDGNEGENLSKNDCTEESIESLRKEVERLKTRLEEERKKLNDVTCKPFRPLSTSFPNLFHCFSSYFQLFSLKF